MLGSSHIKVESLRYDCSATLAQIHCTEVFPDQFIYCFLVPACLQRFYWAGSIFADEKTAKVCSHSELLENVHFSKYFPNQKASSMFFAIVG
mmetsp:Transcript_29819/g.39671  ORF Transcript_29819/g.39671 Transcript_29819/m.39671 type:complete len:92 (+) Transcript_29819:577-852(+)